MRILKRIVEMVFIFLVPLMLLLFGLKINKVYDENNNLTSQYLTYENGIFREYNNNLEYINTIENFNLNETKRNGYFYDSNDVLFSGSNYSTISNINGISVYNNTTYYLYVDTPITPNYILCWVCDGDNNILDYQIRDINETYTPNSNGSLFFTIEYGNQIINVDDVKININVSVVWANGNFVPYGEPLILYSNTDYLDQLNYNYTWYNNALVSLSDHLQFNNNYMIQFIFIYVILIMLNLLLWYVFYVPFDMLFGLLLRKLEYYK